MRTLLEAFNRFKPSRAQLIGGSLILSAGMLALAAVPNTFTSGTTISAAQMNANFSDADTRITTLEATATGGNIVLVGGGALLAPPPPPPPPPQPARAASTSHTDSRLTARSRFMTFLLFDDSDRR